MGWGVTPSPLEQRTQENWGVEVQTLTIQSVEHPGLIPVPCREGRERGGETLKLSISSQLNIPIFGNSDGPLGFWVKFGDYL